MAVAKPVEVRCPRCGEFKAELTEPGHGGRYACCGVSWTFTLVEIRRAA